MSEKKNKELRRYICSNCKSHSYCFGSKNRVLHIHRNNCIKNDFKYFEYDNKDDYHMIFRYNATVDDLKRDFGG